jgi:hypothetical protein
MEKKYEELCKMPSDINEHLPTLYRYAKECESVLECGVRGCVSSWAFLMARPKLLIMNDLDECNVKLLTLMAKRTKTHVKTMWQSDLTFEEQYECWMVVMDHQATDEVKYGTVDMDEYDHFERQLDYMAGAYEE